MKFIVKDFVKVPKKLIPQIAMMYLSYNNSFP